MRFALCTILALCSVAVALNGPWNNRPIIGIVTEPTYDGPLHKLGYTEYFAASYVKWIESGGARVVPLRYTWSEDQMLDVLSHINGVLFSGGGVSLNHSAYENAGAVIYKFAVDSNAKGEYFPLFGTCLGFEELCILSAGGNASVLSGPFDAENISMALDPTQDMALSRMFCMVPQIYDMLTKKSITMNNHVNGLHPDTFKSNPLLADTWIVLSTNKDRKDVEFVSTIEAKNLPFYGTQWHPEKAIYEWRADEAIPHDVYAILANAYPATFYVDEARASNRHFDSIEDEKRHLIYQHTPIYTGDIEPSFRQCYVFK